MAENKKLTRAEAINYAISAVEHTREYWETDGDWSPEKSDEILAVLKKMHEQLVKPRAKAEGPSKTQIVNGNLAEKVKSLMLERGVTSVNSAWVHENVEGVGSTQKGTAVLTYGVTIGLFHANDMGKGKAASYTIA